MTIRLAIFTADFIFAKDSASLSLRLLEGSLTGLLLVGAFSLMLRCLPP